jgi:16S rRNA (uracil1498-N3)-methyltransferase
MARIYRFFTRHITESGLPTKAERPLHLLENIEPEIFFQLAKVLRVRNGDEIVLIPVLQNPPYFEYKYVVESTDKKDIVLRFMEKTENTNEPEKSLSLMLCVPNKPEKMEFILQKAVELGAKRILLLEGDFSQMKHTLRADRLEKIMAEAAEQSERAIIPEIVSAGKLKNYLKALPKEELKNIFVALERECGATGDSGAKGDSEANKRKSAEDVFGGGLSGAQNISVLVGPEGGFSNEEKALIYDLNITCFSLGKRILRMETAAILSLGMAMLLREK